MSLCVYNVYWVKKKEEKPHIQIHTHNKRMKIISHFLYIFIK